MRLRSTAALLTHTALTTVLAGCPGDDSPVTTDIGTTTNDDTTTSTPTTTPMTTEQGTSSGDATTTTGVDSTTTVTLDDTSSSGTPETDSSSGSSGSSGESSGSTTGEPVTCGNGVLDAGEECDTDAGAALCSDQGFDDGEVLCDPVTCLLDFAGCYFVEALQNDNGMCEANELGCTDPGGTAGNPQDMLECYTTTLTPPIDVVQVQYAIGDSVPLPDAADLIIHEWAGPGNLPGVQVQSIPLDPLTDIVAGTYDFVLPTPVNVTTPGFCVGFHGEDAADGFRIDFTDADGTGESFLTAGLCGIAMPTELTGAGIPGNYCIRPTVTSVNP